MRILPLHQEKIRRHIKNRHYNLRMAKISLLQKQLGEMHMFCHLAEVEQNELDELQRRYPDYKFA